MDTDDALKRPNRFEIDLDAVARCTRRIRDVIGPQTRFFATLKSNAYGYGLLPAARTVLKSGADALSLVTLADAVELRRAGITAPILVYAGSVPDVSLVAVYEKHDLIPTLHSEESLDAFGRFATRPLNVAVKIDVGQERVGVPYAEAFDFIRRLMAMPNLRLQIVNSHPGVPTRGRIDETLDWQYRRFVALCEKLAQAGIEVPLRILASSKVLRMRGPSMMLNAVDPGAALFSPFEPGSEDEQCQPFRALKTKLIQVRAAHRDEYLEEAPFALAPGMRIGIVPVGYSDGVHRMHCGEMLVRGQRVPILGAPSLEYTRVDLTRVPESRVGDEVAIIGRQGEARISPEEVVRKQGAGRVSDIALEVRPTIPRVYLGGS